jgi:hypothetical protein
MTATLTTGGRLVSIRIAKLSTDYRKKSGSRSDGHLQTVRDCPCLRSGHIQFYIGTKHAARPPHELASKKTPLSENAEAPPQAVNAPFVEPQFAQQLANYASEPNKPPPKPAYVGIR